MHFIEFSIFLIVSILLGSFNYQIEILTLMSSNRSTGPVLCVNTSAIQREICITLFQSSGCLPGESIDRKGTNSHVKTSFLEQH